MSTGDNNLNLNKPKTKSNIHEFLSVLYVCFRTILVYFSHLFLLLLLCGIKPVNFIYCHSITPYLHIAVAFLVFKVSHALVTARFFTSILAIRKRIKLSFYQVDSVFNCTSWCRQAKVFSYQTFSIFLPDC